MHDRPLVRSNETRSQARDRHMLHAMQLRSAFTQVQFRTDLSESVQEGCLAQIWDEICAADLRVRRLCLERSAR